MSKAEEFIREHTRKCSNQYDLPEYFENGIERLKEYQPWLTPDQARRAVEIAKKEVMDEVCDYIKNNLYKHLYVYDGHAGFPTHQFINDLKQAMKDE